MIGAIVAAAALVSASGATPAKNHKTAGIDVSSRAAIVHYLRSIQVNPKGLVIQRGRLNYAGARCPGKGWTCTRTTHPVVQVAHAGGRNTFTCSAARCIVVQVAPAAAKPNKSVCIETTRLTQSCVITQSSATSDNVAVVYENAGKVSAVTQTASYTASITQQATGTSNSNTACMYQAINLDGSTVVKNVPIEVMLEAHQSATITQDALGSGANSAQYAATPSGNCDTSRTLAQSQKLTSAAKGRSSITQNENAAQNGPNVSLDIEQNQHPTGNGTGVNNAIFSQTNNLQAVANTPAGPVSQTQSSFTGDPQSPLNGGIVAEVDQDSTGQETIQATQGETQCEDAATSDLASCSTTEHANTVPYSLTQNQYGPVGNTGARRSGRHQPYVIHKGNGISTQTGGNGADTFTINQTSNQDSDAGSTQTNNVQADCHTSGNCTVTQNTDVDGVPHTNTQSGQDISTSTNCSGSNCTTVGGSDLIVNGSFEADQFSYGGTLDLGGSNPLTGWTTNSNGVYPWGLPYPNFFNAGPTPYGNQWVIVGDQCNGGTWIEQTINTTIGQTYTLSFALASELGDGQALAEVSFPTGSSTASQTFAAPLRQTNYWDTWATYTMDFQATSANVTIRFTGLADAGGCDPGIDNVAVN